MTFFLTSGRAKKFEDSINKLNKHSDISNSKKQQRNELLTNERPSGLNLLKMGTLMQRNPDLLAPRLEERNRRVRSSVAETRVCVLILLQICSSDTSHRKVVVS